MTPIQKAAYLAHARTSGFRHRVADALRIIAQAASEHGPVAVMSSWGKDSVVLCHLALQVIERPTILHIASSYRLPGWELVAEFFGARADVCEIAPRRTLEETIAWLHEVGLPHERTWTQQQHVVKAIKKDVGSTWCAEHGFKTQALGIRADESATRRKWMRISGPVYQARGVHVAAPLAWWSAQDVWSYIVLHDLPYHQMYDMETDGWTRETIRNSGWLTTDAAHKNGRIQWLRKHYPEQYAALAAHFPQVMVL